MALLLETKYTEVEALQAELTRINEYLTGMGMQDDPEEYEARLARKEAVMDQLRHKTTHDYEATAGRCWGHLLRRTIALILRDADVCAQAAQCGSSPGADLR